MHAPKCSVVHVRVAVYVCALVFARVHGKFTHQRRSVHLSNTAYHHRNVRHPAPLSCRANASVWPLRAQWAAASRRWLPDSSGIHFSACTLVEWLSNDLHTVFCGFAVWHIFDARAKLSYKSLMLFFRRVATLTLGVNWFLCENFCVNAVDWRKVAFVFCVCVCVFIFVFIICCYALLSMLLARVNTDFGILVRLFEFCNWQVAKIWLSFLIDILLLLIDGKLKAFSCYWQNISKYGL